MYAGHGYGSKFSDVAAILARGNHVLTVMDICGAMALKTNFENVITVYIKRDRESFLRAILEEDIPLEEKVNRLISIEPEKNNEEICDYSISFDNVEDAVDKLLAILK
jgi:guanylate kinase